MEIEKLLKLRKELHENPELSLTEDKTIKILEKFVKENTDAEIVPCDGFFYAVHKEGDNLPNVAVRGDMDAILGENGKPFHGCGHDGHSTILSGLAMELSGKKVGKNVYFIFQPAEEIGAGAKKCVQVLKDNNIERVYGLHNIPAFHEGDVLVREGCFACASKGLKIDFGGIQCHAGCPETGINPAYAIAKIINSLKDILNPADYKGLVLATIVEVKVGEQAYGVSAGDGSLSMTIRANFDEDLTKLQNRILDLARELAEKEKMSLDYKFIEEFPDTVNDSETFKECCEKLTKAGIEYKILPEPFRWSEDFGHYLKNCKGMFFGVGCGEDHPGLHTPTYEFDDNIIEKAINTFKALI